MTCKNKFRCLVKAVALVCFCATLLTGRSAVISDVSAIADQTEILYSRGVMVADITLDEICYEKDSDLVLPTASLTKIMTVLLALEKLDSINGEYIFDEDIIEYTDMNNASVVGYLPGERACIGDMLYGAILSSGGDCAMGIARAVAGSEDNFVRFMNERAEELGMENTLFYDSTGLDDRNKSSALDILKLFRKALENEMFYEIITTEEYLTMPTEEHRNGILLKSRVGEGLREYGISDCISGGKTGYTRAAGLCLACFSEVGDHRYVIITLGAGEGENYPKYNFADASVLYRCFVG